MTLHSKQINLNIEHVTEFAVEKWSVFYNHYAQTHEIRLKYFNRQFSLESHSLFFRIMLCYMFRVLMILQMILQTSYFSGSAINHSSPALLNFYAYPLAF